MLRRVPVLWRAARSLDRLEIENERLRAELADLHRLHARVDAPIAPGDGGEDGELPVPPAALRTWVAGVDDPEWFIASGRRAADAILAALARQGRTMDEIDGVLDFGCGCGRVLRHLRAHAAAGLNGTDYNRAAVAWCDEHLPFATFGTNALAPPTRYRAGAFELVYALSVFTHLTEPLQRRWMAELRRVVKPNGLVILSTHGEGHLGDLSTAEQRRFRAGDLVVRDPAAAGRNECGAYHPEAYVRRVLAADFTVVDFQPRGALGNPQQDLYVLAAAKR